MHRAILYSLILLLLTDCSTDQSKTEKIDALLDKFDDYGLITGSVLVAMNGEVICKKGFQYADIESQLKNEADTKFRIASITKQFTAMLVLQLVQEGKLDLQEKISKYYPGFPEEKGDHITVHHLLTHSSGLQDYTSRAIYFTEERYLPRPSTYFVNIAKDLPLEFEPGSRFTYCNVGYLLLGLIIEEITGKSYEDNLQERVFQPLGMSNSGHDFTNLIIENRATGYDKAIGGYGISRIDDISDGQADGGIYSTVEDLFIWDQTLSEYKLLKKEYQDLLFKGHIRNPSSYLSTEAYYGYGWGIERYRIPELGTAVEVVSHSGFFNGFSSLIVRIPEDEHLIVICYNSNNSYKKIISKAIINILYNQPYDPPKKSLFDELGSVIMEQGIEEGVKRYYKIKESEQEFYYFKPYPIELLRIQLTRNGKHVAALELQKILISEFEVYKTVAWNGVDGFKELIKTQPRQGHLHAYLGTWYHLLGEKELALISLEEAIEMGLEIELEEYIKKQIGELEER